MSRAALPRPSSKPAPAGTFRQRPAKTISPVPPGRSWTVTATDGFTARGYLPGWAEEDPSQSNVPLHRFRTELEDIIHWAPFDGQLLRLATGGEFQGEEKWVLTGEIECIPHADDRPPIPVVNIQLIDDFWMTGLGPAELTLFAAQLRAQADLLDGDIRPRLIAYRTDWAAHHR